MKKNASRANHRKAAAAATESSVSREALGYVELLGMTLDEIRELGQEKFEKLLEQAMEADRKRRYAEIDAKLEAMQRMVEAGQTVQAFSAIRAEMRGMSDEVSRQQAIARKFARMVFGSRSERLSSEELKQLCLAFGVSEESYNASIAQGCVPNVPVEDAPEERVGDDAAPNEETKKKRPNHHGRKPLSLAAHVKVIEDKILVAAEERACRECGEEMQTLRFLRHERMEVVPTQLSCHVELREVCACSKCRKDVVNAPNEDAKRTTRRVGTSVVADIIAEKCSEAQPLHRQHKRYERLGWTTPITTLESAYAWGTDLLGPIADVTRGDVLSADYTQADSTGLKILDSKHPSGIFRGQVWTFVSRNGVAFDFCSTWAAQEAAPLFAVNWDAHKQVDDYKGYASLVTHEGMKRQLVPDHLRLGCFMHVRRKYHEALEAKDGRALAPIQIIRALYEVEARAKGCTAEERLALRQQYSLALLAKLKDWVDKHAYEPPKSLLGVAVRYTAAQWPYLERCFTRGEFEIDNGAPEREIRSIAIGRKNYLFSGSVAAAGRLCDAYTLVVNAKRLGLDPFVYLKDVLDLLERDFPINRVAELTPRSYAASKPAQHR